MTDIDIAASENGEGGEEEDTLGVYDGTRNSNNERHGLGWALLPNGDQYDGRYKRGLRCGKGLYVFKNGARYLGEWVKGMKSGLGTFYYPDGSTYEGEWKKDERNGHGKYTYLNGDCYEGAWYKGKRHGVGVYTYKEAQCKFHGTWNDGVRIGPAEIVHKNHIFHGFWDHEDPKGTGVYSYNCKYMSTGFISLIRDPEYDYVSEVTGKNEPGQPRVYVPIWRTKTISKYDYSKLPQQPIPLPLKDSATSSICDVSLYNSEDELMKFEDTGEGEEGEEGEEMMGEEEHE